MMTRQKPQKPENITFVPWYQLIEGGHAVRIAAPSVQALSKRIRRHNIQSPHQPIRTIPGYVCLEDIIRVYGREEAP